jgi:hypothetical protein
MVDLETVTKFRDGSQMMHDAMREMGIAHEHHMALTTLFYRIWDNLTCTHPHVILGECQGTPNWTSRKSNIVALWPQDHRTIGDMEGGEEGYAEPTAVVDKDTIAEEFPIYTDRPKHQHVRIKCVGPHQYEVYFSSVAARKAWLGY